MMAETRLAVPFVIRGVVIDEMSIEHKGDGFVFETPDPIEMLPLLRIPAGGLDELHRVSLAEVIDFLSDLGKRLDPATNPYMAEALELSLLTSRLPARVLRTIYDDQLRYFFRRDLLRDAVNRRLGIAAVEGWVSETGPDGRDVRVRAYGARIAHVIAGNTPGVAAATIARSALTRGDAIIKTPSNDPLTAVAIARTMIDMDPDHPLTKHVSALYWKGGDEAVESAIFHPTVIDKIVAWGGARAIENVARYVGPGLELISLDPKRSMSLLGAESLTDLASGASAAERLARDVGLFNQEGCVNSRVAYVDVTGVENARERLISFGEAVSAAIVDLPADYSSPVDFLPLELQDAIDAAMLFDDPTVIGAGDGTGGVIVSADDEPVDFAQHLAGRFVNLVPVRGFSRVIDAITSEVQTVGVWPPQLRLDLRHDLALAGVQRIVTLGGATNLFGNQTIPQDGIEVLRRMCRWIVDEGDGTESPDADGSVHVLRATEDEHVR
jgi:Acyl-CoA reductase (LuxC)